MSFLKKFAGDDRANAAIEYAIIASGIAVAVITSLDELGLTIRFTLKMVAATINGGPS